MPKNSSLPSRPRLSLVKKLLLLCVAGAMTFLVLEVGLRVVFALRVGPDVLTYGFVAARDFLSEQGLVDGANASYSKYFPNQIRYDSDPVTGEKFDVRINSRGFRGEDFEVEKEPGVLRVVTLGASSTFGWRDRDDETYPHYLEELLNERCGESHRYEVINLGIPHLLTKAIAALFATEGLELEPDVVTFYEGVNDAEGDTAEQPARRALHEVSLLRNVFRFARDHFLLVSYLNEMTARPQTFELEKLEPYFDQKAEYFIGNLEKIRQQATANGALFIAASQQLKSYLVPEDQIHGVTYEQERDRVLEKLADDGRLEPKEVSFLAHTRIMEGLKEWTAENDVPFVDVIEATNQDRDILVSRVHLSPRGNQMVADALAERILALTCEAVEADVTVDS